MLADLAALILNHYDSLLLLMLAGACFTLAGLIWVMVFRRRDVVLGEPDVPTWTETTVAIPLPPKAHYRREDDDTQVIPGIPGALPPDPLQERWLESVDALADELTAATEAFAAIEGLRIIPTAGPVCPTCGGAFGNCACYGQKSGSENEATQVIDLCPLTTQDIPVPPAEPLPLFVAAVEHRSRRHETQDLTVNLAEILERERVA